MIQIENKQKTIEGRSYLRVGTKHKGDYVLKQQIVYIEACENYSWLHLNNGKKLLSCKSIGFYEDVLADDGFIRTHRSYLINLSHLKSYESKYRLVHLKGEIVLPVSHRKNRQFSKRMNGINTKPTLRAAV